MKRKLKKSGARPNPPDNVRRRRRRARSVRTASEVSKAIEELIDRVWYDRKMVLRHMIETGKTKMIAKKDFGPQHYRDIGRSRLVVDSSWADALKGVARLEKKYGKENLGPYSKFDWGMINGKLSALRWMMGDEWDMLDT